MNRLFDYNSKIMQFLATLTQLIILNILFCLCCIPIISVGCAFSGLCSAIRSIADGNGNYLSVYWVEVKNRCKESTLIWLQFLIFSLIFYVDIMYYQSQSSKYTLALVIVLFLIMIIISSSLLLFFLVYPYLSGNLYKKLFTSFIIAFSHPGRTLISVTIFGLFPALFLLYPPLFLGLIPFWFSVFFSVATWCVMMIFRPVFDQIKAAANSNNLTSK